MNQAYPHQQQHQVSQKKTGCLKVLLIIVGISGIAIIGGCALLVGVLGSSEKKHQHAEPSQESFKIGETVTFDDSQWEVLEARSLGTALSGDGGFVETKRTSGRFVYVKFKVANTTNREKSILRTPEIKDSKGRSFEQMNSVDLSLHLSEGEDKMSLEQLPASVPKTFSGIYEVATDSSDLSFMARELGFGGDEKAVKLGF